MLCKVKGCEGQVVSRKRCAKHIDGHFSFVNNQDIRWDEGAPEGNERAKRTNVVERMIPDYAEVAKTHTPAQMAEMYGGHADTVRRFLNSRGIEVVRHCRKCGVNRPESSFDGPARRTCNQHEKVTHVNKHTEREWDDHMWRATREVIALSKRWLTTENGKPRRWLTPPNGPYRAIDGGY